VGGSEVIALMSIIVASHLALRPGNRGALWFGALDSRAFSAWYAGCPVNR
jgi:hypothetical protein